MTRNPAAATKLALLIDGDNISATYMPLIMREAEKRGAVAIRRVYGQFKSGKMKSWMKQIDDFDLTPVNVSPLTRGKNATDMKLTIEAMDMLNGRQLDGICIASSDGDFTPLAERIRASALSVFGFGAKKAPKGYKDAFDRFYECDTQLAEEKKRSSTIASKAAAPKANPPPQQREQPAPAAKPDRKSPPPAKPARPASPTANTPVPESAILAAIDDAKRGDGWSHLGTVGKKLRESIADFAAKHGNPRLKRQIDGMKQVETKPGDPTYVRRRPA